MNQEKAVYQRLSMGSIGEINFESPFILCRIAAILAKQAESMSVAVKKPASLWQIIQRAFAALSFEHSGEYMPLSHKNRLLTGELPEVSASSPFTCSQQELSLPKRILLAFENEIDLELLRYNVRAARQFNAEIDILTRQNHDVVCRCMAKVMGNKITPWRIIKLEASIQDAVAEYAESLPGVLFTVTSQSEIPEHSSGKSRAA